MHSLPLMNAAHQHLRPPLQASQAVPHRATDEKGNHHAWTGNNPFYRTLNSGVLPSQSADFSVDNAAYSNRRMANGQTSANPHQAINSQQTKGNQNDNYLLKMLLGEVQQQQQRFQSTQNQGLPNTCATSAMQDLSLFWKPTVKVNERQSLQDDTNVSHLQNIKAYKALCQNSATVHYVPVVNTSTSVSTAAHTSQTVQVVQNQIPRQNGAQYGLPTFYPRHTARQYAPYRKCTNAGNSSNTNTMNQCEKGPFLPNANMGSLNSSVVAPQRVQRHKRVVKTSTAGSGSHCPPYNGHHLVISKNYNTTAHQPSPLLVKSVQKTVPLREQHSVNVPLQQNYISYNNVTPERSPVGSVSNSFQPTQVCDVSSSRNKTQSFSANNLETSKKPELLLSGQQNDSSAHLMPGYKNTKAVAVVQPLSQESCHTPSNTANCKSPIKMYKDCISPDVAKNTEAACLREDPRLHPENPQLLASKVLSKDGTASHSEPQNSYQNSDPRIIATDAPNPTGFPGQSCPAEQMTVTTPTRALELSSLPTTPWTTTALTNLILEAEKVQRVPEDAPKQKTTVKIISMFWDRNPYAWLHSYKEGWHKDLVMKAKDFLDTHLTQDTVILSQVKQGFEEQLKHYHVLEDDAYSEQPFKSSWLNVNDQLDDIDKECGFPLVLKQHAYVLDSDKQRDGVKLASSSPVQVANDVENKILSQRDAESVAVIEGNQGTTVKTPSTSPGNSGEFKTDNSTDSCYSFKIEVLTPEEAKVVYEEVHASSHQSTDCQEKTPVQSETPKDMDITVEELKTRKGAVNPIDQVCCLAKFMEMNSGLHTPSSKCLCREEQSGTEFTDKTSSSDTKSPLGSKEDGDCQILTLGVSELCKELFEIIDLTDSDDDLCAILNEELKVISQMSGDRQPVIENINVNEDADRVLVIPDEMPGTEDESVEFLNSTNTMQSTVSVSIAEQTKVDDFYETETKVDLQVSEQKDSGPALLESADAGDLPVATKEQAKVIDETAPTTPVADKIHQKKRRPSELHTFFSSTKESKKCKLPFDLGSKHAPEAQPSVSAVKTFELVLFGSAQGKKSTLEDNGKCHFSPPVKIRPPKVLSVNLNPSKNSTEAPDGGKSTVKQRLYEKWRKSIPIMSVHRKKLKRSLSASLLEMSPKTEKRPILSETRVSDCNSKHKRSLKRGSSLSKRFDEVKRRRYSVALEKPAHEKSKHRRDDAATFQENIILKFSVLPNTFSFKDGRKEATDSISDKPEGKRVEGKKQHVDKVGPESKGLWIPPEKQYKPLRIQKTFSLFHEYQKKYKEKTQSSNE
ncbi:uncharacterized protein si:ch211-106e7.2 [Cololabis saira]|uniref:uncharacterized protein si:ch211-106e7.2 n=1 Tax=Cololabis saira TaxID=129043 RepID=UPI002AD2D6B2|nr:uncharacterized protein si:ch211-106e7.2 [Cololabis saira]